MQELQKYFIRAVVIFFIVVISWNYFLQIYDNINLATKVPKVGKHIARTIYFIKHGNDYSDCINRFRAEEAKKDIITQWEIEICCKSIAKYVRSFIVVAACFGCFLAGLQKWYGKFLLSLMIIFIMA